MRYRTAASVVVGIVALTAGAALAGAELGPRGGAVAPSAATSTPSASRPSAWSGELAYVSHDELTVVDRQGTRHRVGLPVAGVPSRPAWSHDGRWLAFLVLPAATAAFGSSGTLCVVRPNGTDARALGMAGQFAWDPRADTLAYLQTGKLRLGQVEGARTTLPPLGENGFAQTIAWGPSGRALAVSVVESGPSGGRARLEVLVTGARAARAVATSTTYSYRLAGWWPDGKGFLYWADEAFSSSIAADGLPLVSMNLASGVTHVLSHGLPHPEWVAWSPNGGTVAVVAGMDRVVWDGAKHIVLCQAASGSCRPEPQPDDATAIDPAWSASGDLYFAQSTGTVAYTAGPPRVHGLPPGPAFRWQAVEAWAAAGQLRSAPALGGEPRASTRVPGGSGGQAPTPAGPNLLFVRAGALWLLPGHSAAPVRISGRLGPFGTADPGYYGYDDWQQTFAWHK